MRNELGANKVITRPQEFFDLLFDHRVVIQLYCLFLLMNFVKEISAIIPLSDDAIRVLYKNKKNFVSEHASSNIA